MTLRQWFCSLTPVDWIVRIGVGILIAGAIYMQFHKG